MKNLAWLWEALLALALGVMFVFWHVGMLLAGAMVMALLSIDTGLRKRTFYPLLIVAVSVVVVLAGWTYIDHARNTVQVQPVPMSGGVPFIPSYIDIITGVQTSDDACHPKNLHDLLLPCDK